MRRERVASAPYCDQARGATRGRCLGVDTMRTWPPWIIMSIVCVAVLIGVAPPATAQNQSRSSMAIRDSSGVRVVENRATSDVRGSWRVASDPVFRVGWAPGEPEFENITTGVILAANRVVVGDRGSSLLRILSPSGTVEATMGGDGEGPGEFKSIAGMLHLSADSFLVVDTGNLRITFFDGEDYVHDLRFVGRYGEASYSPIGRSGDRYILHSGGASVRSLLDGKTGWRWSPLFSTDAQFEERDSIGATARFLVLEPDDWNPVRHYGFAVFTGGLIAYAQTDRPQVTWMDADGGIVQIARWDARLRPATDADWDGFERRIRARTNQPDQALFERQLRERRRDFEGPMPLFLAAYGDRTGNVWFSEYDLSTLNVMTYFVLSREGEWLGSVTFPKEIRILQISDDRVLGVETDEFDVQAVVLYRLEKPAGR